MYSFSVETNESSPTTASTGARERQDDPQKIWAGRRAVDARRLVELGRDRVEEADMSHVFTPSAPPR